MSLSVSLHICRTFPSLPVLHDQCMWNKNVGMHHAVNSLLSDAEYGQKQERATEDLCWCSITIQPVPALSFMSAAAESGPGDDRDHRLCLQALWPTHPFPHATCAAAAVSDGVWTGGEDGVIVW